jgi:opacity protein-like surface antigen
MNTFKTSIVALALVGAAATQAHAADATPDASYSAMGFYLRGDIGWSFLEWSGRDDNELVAGGGIGYVINDNLRTDLRVDWAGFYDTTPSADDMTLTTVLGNVYFDIPMDTMITPYLGAGVGYGFGSVDGGKDKDGMAFALMAGASFSVTDNIDIDVGYRFREILASGNNPMEHQVMTGLRFGF